VKITQKLVTELIPYVNNSRTHSDEQVAQIAASIKEFGWTNPILVDGSNGIIAGHGRLMAARKLGYKEVPTIELADLTETQKKAYIIADNRLALNAGWDNEMLTIELNDLLADGFALDILGFDASEIAELLGEEEDEEIKEPKGKLSDRFLIPPFSVLNAREGWWQDRKRAWLALGIKSEEGRGEGDVKAAPGGSVMVAGYDKNGNRLTGLKNIGKSNG
jgi:ParB-like chromosome segregation protein Spo0J